MSAQMVVRIEADLKEKVSRLAKAEGKSLSEVVRELLERYARERDMGSYIDELWERIGAALSEKGVSEADIEGAIRGYRAGNAR